MFEDFEIEAAVLCMNLNTLFKQKVWFTTNTWDINLQNLWTSDKKRAI